MQVVEPVGGVRNFPHRLCFALDALKDGFFGEQAPAMILVEYDSNTQKILDATVEIFTDHRIA